MNPRRNTIADVLRRLVSQAPTTLPTGCLIWPGAAAGRGWKEGKGYGVVSFNADSMAWSFAARHRPALSGCTHQNCANCLRFALQWREEVLRRIERAHHTPRQLCFSLRD